MFLSLLVVVAACGGTPPAPAASAPRPSRCPPAPGKLDKCHLVEAMQSVNELECAQANGPKATSMVRVTFEPDGHVSEVAVEGGLGDSSVGDCLKQKFSAVKVAPFQGAKVVGSRAVDLR